MLSGLTEAVSKEATLAALKLRTSKKKEAGKKSRLFFDKFNLTNESKYGLR